MDTNIKLQR